MEIYARSQSFEQCREEHSGQREQHEQGQDRMNTVCVVCLGKSEIPPKAIVQG